MTGALGSSATDSLLPGLPDEARLWIFGVSRALSPSEEARLLTVVDAFLARWKAHGAPLAAAREWRLGRFLFVGVDERVTPPSGCSIDALVHRLRGIESEFAIELVGGSHLWYRSAAMEGSPTRVSRPDFRARAERGEIGGETLVFDLALTRVGEARAGKWELPARDSWHHRYLPSDIAPR